MKKVIIVSLVLANFFCISAVMSQTDSSNSHFKNRIKRIEAELKTDTVLKKKYDDLTFYYSQMMRNMVDSQELNKIKISAYIEAYYAKYTDEIPLGTYQKFPTSAPISKAFGLNMAMVNMQYQNDKVNGVMTLHAGDIASSAWSPQYNFIQEAHIGIKLYKQLWLEGGYFRTHLGFESIQPRENIGSTIALTTYYEPYFLSGAKLTYYLSDKLSLQVNAFNGFNTFVTINKKKAYGFTAVYEPRKNLIFSYNILTSDNTADSITTNHFRLYNDFYIAYKSKRFNLGLETNFGIQNNSDLLDSTKTAYMFSLTAAAKYKFRNDKYSVYSRIEFFNDPNEILTGPISNANHQLVGIQAFGLNLGFEFKPIPNAYLRLEGRYLHLLDDETIFYTNKTYTHIRNELVSSLGFWF